MVYRARTTRWLLAQGH
uniref:Uncharacterized protein n=1 Tax=Anguilla anguilla TaxID=7936 RepID=A0A0E9TA14_ANGAN